MLCCFLKVNICSVTVNDRTEYITGAYESNRTWDQFFIKGQSFEIFSVSWESVEKSGYLVRFAYTDIFSRLVKC